MVYDVTMRSKDSGLTFTEQARRAQIVGAAIEVISAVGYPRASIAKIADHVGIAKSVVLYHFATKDTLVAAIVADVLARGATVMVPAMAAESTASGKLAAYIRSNMRFMRANNRDTVAMLEIITGFRTETGLRLDQNLAAADPPQGDLALLDPVAIFELGVGNGEFRELSPVLMRNALRATIDGAAWELGRDPDYDVIAYGEELVEIFARATRRDTTRRDI
jgi:AcrR family transcriptional regulator